MAGIKTRLEAEFDVRLYRSIRFDFELLHYSAGASFRVMGGREHVRTETVQDAFVLSQKIFLLGDFEGIPKER